MILDLGLTDYERSYRAQREAVSRRRLGEIEDTLILAEHKNVFTMGRTGSADSLLIDKGSLREIGISVLNVDRGGGITFHGPGQLVVYPVIRLRDKWRDLHKYMRALEDVAIKFLERYSLRPERAPGRTGVWVSGKKVVSIGIGVSGWVTYHGMSVNINPDLGFFDMIYPCGLRGVKMTSLKELNGIDLPMEEAKERIVSDFDRVFKGGKKVFSMSGHDDLLSGVRDDRC
ncbi:MAG: lipoyl(octanoyl) transferase LipB [Candidatus Omnitrophota bacterium]